MRWVILNLCFVANKLFAYRNPQKGKTINNESMAYKS